MLRCRPYHSEQVNDSTANKNPPHPRLDTVVTPLTFSLSPPTLVTSGPTQESSIAQEQTMPVRTDAARTSQKNCWRPQWFEDQGQGNQAKQMDSDRDSLWAQRLHLLPEPQRGSPSADRLPHSVSPTRFLSSSPHHRELRQRSPAGPKAKSTTRSLALSLEEDSFTTGSEVRPAARSPRQKDQKTE